MRPRDQEGDIKMAQQRDVGVEVRGLNSGSSSENGQDGMDLRAIVDAGRARNDKGDHGTSW